MSFQIIKLSLVVLLAVASSCIGDGVKITVNKRSVLSSGPWDLAAAPWSSGWSPLPWQGGSGADAGAAVAAAQAAAEGVRRAQVEAGDARRTALQHQKLAQAKESAAALAIKSSEESNLRLRAEARAASASALRAQEEAAAAGARVAAAQREAAHREQVAAAALRAAAHHAAAHIQKADVESAKLTAIQSSEAAASASRAAAAREAALAPLNAATPAVFHTIPLPLPLSHAFHNPLVHWA